MEKVRGESLGEGREQGFKRTRLRGGSARKMPWKVLGAGDASLSLRRLPRRGKLATVLESGAFFQSNRMGFVAFLCGVFPVGGGRGEGRVVVCANYEL